MQQRLLKNSQDLVSNSFRDHIILKVIEKSCKQYESRMNTMRFSTIEIFVEVVNMIDEIREYSLDYDFENAFDNLFCRLREYDSSANNADAKMATSVCITWVAYLLFQCYDNKDAYDHWAHRLTRNLKTHDIDYLQILREINSKLPAHQHEEIKAYILDYIDNSDKWMSQLITDTITYDGMNRKLIEDLKPLFYTDKDLIAHILAYIKEVKAASSDSAIAKITVKYIREKKISDYDKSFKSSLWTILNEHELYKTSKDNWNKSINKTMKQ